MFNLFNQQQDDFKGMTILFSNHINNIMTKASVALSVNNTLLKETKREDIIKILDSIDDTTRVLFFIETLLDIKSDLIDSIDYALSVVDRLSLALKDTNLNEVINRVKEIKDTIEGIR